MRLFENNFNIQHFCQKLTSDDKSVVFLNGTTYIDIYGGNDYDEEIKEIIVNCGLQLHGCLEKPTKVIKGINFKVGEKFIFHTSDSLKMENCQVFTHETIDIDGGSDFMRERVNEEPLSLKNCTFKAKNILLDIVESECENTTFIADSITIYVEDEYGKIAKLAKRNSNAPQNVDWEKELGIKLNAPKVKVIWHKWGWSESQERTFFIKK